MTSRDYKSVSKNARFILYKENVNDNDNEADILYFNISLKFICSVYDKSDKFKFSVVRLNPRFSIQSDNVGYCTFEFCFTIYWVY